MVACLALIAPALGYAQGDAAEEALRACVAEKDDARRLACYDRALKPRTESPAPAAAAAAAAAESKAPAPAAPVVTPGQEDKFGYHGAIAREELDEKAAREAGVGRLEAAVVEVERRPRGELVLTLDNGQVWAQRAADSSRVKVGDRVTIRKGTFNSFLLVLPNNRSTRVTREK